jgi:cytosine/creatinine deaminase
MSRLHQMPPDQRDSDASRNRRLVSQLLVAALFAVAYSEMVGPVTEAFNKDGINIQTLAWPLIYMATVLRFFIGNILHLESPYLTGPDAAFKWFWDVFIIIAEGVILIFAGAVTTIDASAEAHVSFTDYLLILYVVDVIWLGSMRLLSKAGGLWPRPFGPMVRGRDEAPFEWAWVNIGLIMLMGWLGVIGHPDHISDLTLCILVGANVIAFAWDVVAIAYGIREPNADSISPLAPPIRSFSSRSAALIAWIRDPRGSKKKIGSGMSLALSNARQSLSEGGIPVGAALLSEKGRTMGVGRNRRVQRNNPILHAEIDCLANAARHQDYSATTMYSTVMPCHMCAGAIIQFGIPRVVVGESENFSGARDLLRSHGVKVIDLKDSACRDLLAEYISRHPDTWQEDIGK